jgi:ribonuclease BN (tRNA processing enzyme)
LLITHRHWDHLLGFPFFKPIYRNHTHLHIYACPFGEGSVQEMLARTMVAPYFPVNLGGLAAEISYHGVCTADFEVGGLQISPVSLSHPNGGVGFRISESGRTFMFLTDNELGYVHPGGLDFDGYVAACRGVDLLVHDAEFTVEEYRKRRTWGHSTVRDATRLAVEAGVGRLGLFHHNQDRGDEQVEALVDGCRQEMGATPIPCFAMAAGMELDV